MIVVVFLGRSIEGILADVRREFPGDDVLVITRENDSLQPPAGVSSCSVGAFAPAEQEEYRVVANGGTTRQILPVLKKLVESHADFTAWDLQRDGKVQVW